MSGGIRNFVPGTWRKLEIRWDTSDAKSKTSIVICLVFWPLLGTVCLPKAARKNIKIYYSMVLRFDEIIILAMCYLTTLLISFPIGDSHQGSAGCSGIGNTRLSYKIHVSYIKRKQWRILRYS